jgi:hypothetical protein
MGTSQNGSITIYGVRGSYTINLQTNELSLANGVTITNIPPEVATQFANTFQGIADDPASQVEQKLAATPPPPDPYSDPPPPNPYSDCDKGGLCETYRAGPANAPSQPKPRRPNNSIGARRPGGMTAMIAGSTAKVAYYGEPTCNDIAMSIYAGAQEWRRNVRDVEDALAEVEQDLLDYVTPERHLSWDEVEWLKQFIDPAALGVHVLILDVRLAEEVSTRINLSFLAIQYSSFGCWNPSSGNWQPASHGTSVGPSFGNSSTSYGWVCSTTLMNDKDGWPQPVEKCEYMFAA